VLALRELKVSAVRRIHSLAVTTSSGPFAPISFPVSRLLI